MLSNACTTGKAEALENWVGVYLSCKLCSSFWLGSLLSVCVDPPHWAQGQEVKGAGEPQEPLTSKVKAKAGPSTNEGATANFSALLQTLGIPLILIMWICLP